MHEIQDHYQISNIFLKNSNYCRIQIGFCGFKVNFLNKTTVYFLHVAISRSLCVNRTCHRQKRLVFGMAGIRKPCKIIFGNFRCGHLNFSVCVRSMCELPFIDEYLIVQSIITCFIIKISQFLIIFSNL